jgi:hypothetical protein
MPTKKKSLKKPAVDERKLELWKKRGEALAESKQRNQWAIGSWLLAGEKEFGKKMAYDKAEQATGMARGTLYQFKYTAESFPISTRVKKLAFGHHRLVASEEYKPDERKALLKHAAGKSVASFAAYLRNRKKDATRRADKRSPADQSADKVVDACDVFLRNYNFTMLLNEPPTPTKRTELLETLKKAAADLNGKIAELSGAWADEDEADAAFQQEEALGVAAGK